MNGQSDHGFRVALGIAATGGLLTALDVGAIAYLVARAHPDAAPALLLFAFALAAVTAERVTALREDNTSQPKK